MGASGNLKFGHAPHISHQASASGSQNNRQPEVHQCCTPSSTSATRSTEKTTRAPFTIKKFSPLLLLLPASCWYRVDVRPLKPHTLQQSQLRMQGRLLQFCASCANRTTTAFSACPLLLIAHHPSQHDTSQDQRLTQAILPCCRRGGCRYHPAVQLQREHLPAAWLKTHPNTSTARS